MKLFGWTREGESINSLIQISPLGNPILGITFAVGLPVWGIEYEIYANEFLFARRIPYFVIAYSPDGYFSPMGKKFRIGIERIIIESDPHPSYKYPGEEKEFWRFVDGWKLLTVEGM